MSIVGFVYHINHTRRLGEKLKFSVLQGSMALASLWSFPAGRVWWQITTRKSGEVLPLVPCTSLERLVLCWVRTTYSDQPFKNEFFGP